MAAAANQNSRQQELKSRLYDKGLSEKTMPSVHRPQEALANTPATIKAKLKNIP